jgi:hypothetical protein
VLGSSRFWGCGMGRVIVEILAFITVIIYSNKANISSKNNNIISY